jgi:hypothetical protein
VSEFVGRPAETAELERVLLPERHSCRQKIFVLHGLGGIGKTSLVHVSLSCPGERSSAGLKEVLVIFE